MEGKGKERDHTYNGQISKESRQDLGQLRRRPGIGQLCANWSSLVLNHMLLKKKLKQAYVNFFFLNKISHKLGLEKSTGKKTTVIKLHLNVCCVLSRSVTSDSLRPRGLQPTRLLCLWDSPGKNTGVGCHALLQGIFPTQGLNSGLLHCHPLLKVALKKGNVTKR